jgi:hypothetical protein
VGIGVPTPTCFALSDTPPKDEVMATTTPSHVRDAADRQTRAATHEFALPHVTEVATSPPGMSLRDRVALSLLLVKPRDEEDRG